MIISFINHSNGKVSDADAQETIRAINRQIAQDFEPYWSMGAELRLEGHAASQPQKIHPTDMRGDAVLYLWDQTDVAGAIGYHDLNNSGIPFGFVFLEIARQLNEPWSVTLSHEALELIADSEVNVLVAGPHPDPAQHRFVFHWYEMCDAVQAETYQIDSVYVSNFVLPLYFTEGDETARNDFLATQHNGHTLRSFGVNPGGYVGFFDPTSGSMDTYMADKRAADRMEIKARAQLTRRAIRYEAIAPRTKRANGAVPSKTQA